VIGGREFLPILSSDVAYTNVVVLTRLVEEIGRAAQLGQLTDVLALLGALVVLARHPKNSLVLVKAGVAGRVCPLMRHALHDKEIQR